MKRRIAAVEKRLSGLARLSERPQLVFSFGDEIEPQGEKAEDQDKRDGPIVFNMPRPSQLEDDRVLRFDFGTGEGEKK